jgi:hypothetical protein
MSPTIARTRQFFREGRADHQRALAVGFHFCATSAPRAGTAACRHVQELQIRTARIRGAAQDDHAAIAPLHVRLDRIKAHVRIDGHGIGTVAVVGFARVLARRGADVAALGVEDQRDVRIISRT